MDFPLSRRYGHTEIVQRALYKGKRAGKIMLVHSQTKSESELY